MSKLGIGLFYFALAGAVAAAIFGFMLVQKYNGTLVTITQTKQSLTAANSATKKAKEEADAANKAKDEATTELTESKSKVDDLNTKLAAAQTAQDALNTQLQTANDAADKAKKDLQSIKDELGMSPDDIKASIARITDMLGPFEHASLQVNFGMLPFDEAQRSMRLFGEAVLPAFPDSVR